MSEYSFRVSGPFPAGRVVFRFVNAGRESHAPMLVALDDSATLPADEGSQKPHSLGTRLASVNPREPGDTGAFAADFKGGQRYALVCRYSTPEGVPHAEKGMRLESRAEVRTAPPAP